MVKVIRMRTSLPLLCETRQSWAASGAAKDRRGLRGRGCRDTENPHLTRQKSRQTEASCARSVQLTSWQMANASKLIEIASPFLTMQCSLSCTLAENFESRGSTFHVWIHLLKKGRQIDSEAKKRRRNSHGSTVMEANDRHPHL